MSTKVYAELTEDFIRRMRNWALTDAGVGLYASAGTLSAIYRLGTVRGKAPIPVLIGEAADTSRALNVIPARYRQAVMWFWQYEGRPLSWFAMRRDIDYRTFEVWVMKGHEALKTELGHAREAAAFKREQHQKVKNT